MIPYLLVQSLLRRNEAKTYATLQVATEDSVDSLQANLAGISGIESAEQLLIHNGRPLQPR